MDPIDIILIIFALALAFGIGANDETMATVVGSKVLKLKPAIILGAILAFAGCFWLSAGVGKTIGASMLGEKVEYNSFMMLAIILSTAIWLVVASRTGAPISTTHSVVGSIFGISLVWAISTGNSFMDSIFWPKMGQVVMGWITSPLLGFFGAVLFQFVISKMVKLRSKGLMQIEETEKYFIFVLLGTVCFTQLSRGGNDAANAIGVFYGIFPTEGDPAITLLLFISGIMLALGLFIVGKNVIKSVGGSLAQMRPSDAFSISIATTIVIFIATLAGLPISGSHILIFAILGSGWVKGEKPDKKSFRKMVMSWVLTFPVAAGLSAIFYFLFLPLI
ncbi:MAG: inorganic phosphate transporter [archaeon]|nr:inorganic phosphate transporter [archaeon]